MPKAEYRSSIRSKNLIRSALLSLMKDKSFDQITISEVAQKAGVNRGTFYAHYRNLSEVLESIQEEMASQIGGIFHNMVIGRMLIDIERILGDVVSFIKKDPDYYRVLLSIDNGRNLVDIWRKSVTGYLESASFLSGKVVGSISSYRCAVSFVVNGIADAFIDSILGRSGIPLDDLPRELGRIVRAVMEPFLH